MTAGDFLFAFLGRKNKRAAEQKSTYDPLASNSATTPPMSSLTFNRSSANQRERALSTADSNGSGSTIPAGCCAFLINGLRQGVTFISLIKAQEYPEVVTSRKMMLMWLHTCASVGYGLGRMTGGSPRSCLKPRTIDYSLPRSDPIGITFISTELNGLFTESLKKKSSEDSSASIAPSAGLPHVIVVMPVFAKSKASLERLEQALEVLSTQNLMPMAVLLIDDCGPKNLVEHFQGALPHFTLKQRSSGKEGITLSGIWRSLLNILVLRLDANRGPAFARNAGLKAAAASFPPPSPLSSNSGPGSSGLPPNPRCPSLPSQMMVACLLDLGCIPSSNQWTFHHATAQASIGTHMEGEPSKASAASRASSKSSKRRDSWVGRLGGIVVGRAMASKALHPVGVYHDLFGTLNCRKLDDGTLLYGTSCNMSLPLHLFLADQESTFPPPELDQGGPHGGPSRPHVSPQTGGLIRFNESFPAPAFEDVQFCLDARAQGVPMVEDASNEASVVHDYAYSSYGLFQQVSTVLQVH